MDNKDQIKDLFAEKLGQMEMPVRPDLWSAVSSQIGSGAVAGSSAAGLSLISKIIIGVSVVAASTVTGIYLLSDSKTEKTVVSSKEESIVANNNAKSDQQVVESPSIDEKKSTDNESQVISHSGFPVVVIEDEVVSHPEEKVNESSTSQTNTNSGSGGSSTQGEKGTTNATQSNTPNETIVENPPVEEIAVNNQSSDVVIKSTNIFTPNNDGENDEFFIDASGKLNDFNIVILDQMNKVVFQSSDPNFKWDGRNQGGDSVEAGVYLYYLTAVDDNGKKVTKANSLTIRR